MNAAGARILACSLLALSFVGCRNNGFPTYPANYREYVYVTNGGSGTITVLDVVNVRIDRELPVGQNPVAVAASPTRNEVYVVNSGTPNGQGSLSIINAENNTVAGAIPLHRQPVSIDIDQEGKLAYVANSGSNSISVVDLLNRREVAQVGAGEEPVAARLSPDGKTLAVANRKGNSLSLFDPLSLTVRSVFAGCPGASDVVILPDSSKAFVACSAGHQVMAVALARASQPASPQSGAAAIPAQADRLEALMDVGHAPVQLALKPDGGEVFVSNLLSDSVSEIYNTSDEVGATYMIGDGPSARAGFQRQLPALCCQLPLPVCRRLRHQRRQARRCHPRWRRSFGNGIFCRGQLAVRRRYTVGRCRSSAYRGCCGREFRVQVAVRVHFPVGRPQPQRHRRQVLQAALALLLPPPRHAELRPGK